MNEPVYRIDKKHNRKMLIWFLVCLLIAILPWLLLAQNQFDEKSVVDREGKDKRESTSARLCEKASMKRCVR